jgi:hypothetical protein
MAKDYEPLGFLIDDDPPPRPSVLGREYCESCGRVGDHAGGCPQATADYLLNEFEREEREEREEQPLVHLRRAAAAFLRRIARRFDP